jgi:hypothetical protein
VRRSGRQSERLSHGMEAIGMGLHEQKQSEKLWSNGAGPQKDDTGEPGGDGQQRRRWPRTHVIKSAKLLFDTHRLLDCLVLNESAGGVMVDLGTMVTLPYDMTIQFSNGASFPAQRRWAEGTKAGLAFTGSQIIREDSAQRMRNMAEILQSQGLAATIETLRMARFFDNSALRQAAEEAEAAQSRFKSILLGRSGGG